MSSYKILKDSARFCKILQDSARLCKILRQLSKVLAVERQNPVSLDDSLQGKKLIVYSVATYCDPSTTGLHLMGQAGLEVDCSNSKSKHVTARV